MKLKCLEFLAVSMLILASCTPGYQIETPLSGPTSQPALSATSTQEATSAATQTPEPTSTPIPEPSPTPAIVLGEAVRVEEGGFSFRPPYGCRVDINGGYVGISDEEITIMISLMGATSSDDSMSLEELIDEFLGEVAITGQGQFVKGEPYPLTIGGVEGLSFDLTGTLFGSSLQGQSFVVRPEQHQYLYGMGIANLEANGGRWEDMGKPVFDAILSSIEFSSEVEIPCQVSDDETYGRLPEDPVEIGGGAFGGPSREEAYLDNLLGPDAEEISYARVGSLPIEETILDIYNVTYQGISAPVVIYFDEYNYSPLLAPAGFTCKSDFSLIGSP
jgi:hypothetical protein